MQRSNLGWIHTHTYHTRHMHTHTYLPAFSKLAINKLQTYHRVTTSFEYVFVGIDLALARPEHEK